MLSHPQAQSLKAGHGFAPSESAVLTHGDAPVQGSPPRQGPPLPRCPAGLGSRPSPDSCPGREWRDLRRAPTHARGIVQPDATAQPEPGAGGEGGGLGQRVGPMGSQARWQC